MRAERIIFRSQDGVGVPYWWKGNEQALKEANGGQVSEGGGTIHGGEEGTEHRQVDPYG